MPKFDVQTIGSCWTYLRRYLLQGMAALASEDDDGYSLQGANGPIPAKRPMANQAGARQTSNSDSQFPEPRAEEDRLKVYVLKVQTRETKAKPPVPYYAVKINGKVRNTDLLFCWHLSLGSILEKANEQTCVFKVKEDKGFINILDVLAVGQQEFKNGIPVNPDAEPATTTDSSNPEITDSDLPEEMFGR